MGGLEKAALIFLALMVGLDLFGRWTGRSFSLNLLGQNQLGNNITAAARRLSAQSGTGTIYTGVGGAPLIPIPPLPQALPVSTQRGAGAINVNGQSPGAI
jgi:hypothetical protein